VVAADSLVTLGSDGAVAANSGTWSDPTPGAVVSLSASIGTVTRNANGTWSWSYATIAGPPRSQQVVITATDNLGNATNTDFWLNVGQVFPVRTAADNGDDLNPTPDSLRWAIIQANHTPNGTLPDLIAFHIPGVGPHTIRPSAVYPDITDPVIIDGYTQFEDVNGNGVRDPEEPGASRNTLLDGDNAGLLIELDCSLVPRPTTLPWERGVLRITAGSSTVTGLVINRLTGGGIAPIQLDVGGGNHIQGNFIGTDVTGTSIPLAPGQTGPDLSALAADSQYGIHIGNSRGNWIGVKSGQGDTPDPGERNIISGLNFGVAAGGSWPGWMTFDQGADLVVAGNFIGTDRTGTQPLGNFTGVAIGIGTTRVRVGTDGDGRYDDLERNVISGNRYGVVFGGSSSPSAPWPADAVVAGNSIGTDWYGNSDLGNVGGGIGAINAPQNVVIGGLTEVMANIIAFNGKDPGYDPKSGRFYGGGVMVANFAGTPTGFSIRGNSIHDNYGLGIDLINTGFYLPDGVTLHDSAGHDGPNHLQNFPVLASATATDTGTVVTGTLHNPWGQTRTYRIEFFSNSEPGDPNVKDPTDPNRYGEGEHFLGYADVPVGAGETKGFTATGLAAVPAGHSYLTATATDLITGDTSEFSGAIVNRVPTADPGGPYTVPEGEEVTLSGAGSADPDGDPLTYSWDVNGDGKFEDAYGVSPTLTWARLVALGIDDGRTPTSPSTFAVRVRVSDGLHQPVTSDPTTLTVTNVAPTVTVTGPSLGLVDQVITFTFTATDLSPVDQNVTPGVLNSGVFTYDINWDGNGSFEDTRTAGSVLTVERVYRSASANTVQVKVTDKDGGTSAPTTLQFQVNSVNAANLQAVIDGLPPPPPGSRKTVTFSTSNSNAAVNIVNAVNHLAAQPDSAKVAVYLNLGSGDYQGAKPSPPANVQLYITGVSGTKMYGSSPALTVTSGEVIVTGVTFINDTDAPTILVTGGSLTIRGSTIQESTGYVRAAIEITGGTLDLGTAADPGGNTINVNGSGEFVHDGTANVISAVGATFTVDGVPLAPSALSGTVFEDFNDDGQVDFGEKGIANVLITLAGTDDLGDPVSQSLLTDSDGAYVFLNLRPGSYTITETQPAGYAQGIDGVGTTGGGLPATDQFLVNLAPAANGLNYNFGERPAATGPVQKGQTAGIGFWNNKNGQALILSFNGGTGTQLADWLAATLPHMFGIYADSNNLAGKSNAYVAALFQNDFVVKGVKLDAQVLATALSVYATNATLDGTGVATKYGFVVSGDGVGAATWNVGSGGDAFGVDNNSTLTVMDLLLATDAQAINGVLYGGNTTRRNEANAVYSALNQAGAIS
jgi:hypothetical protein